MAGPLQIEHLELALDPEAPFHLNFARAQEEILTLLTNAVMAVAIPADVPVSADGYSAPTRQDVELAVRAVSLCGHVHLPGTLSVLAYAARSPRPGLRLAVAAALEFRADDRPELLASLLADRNARVKARALSVLARRPVRRRVRHLAALKRLRVDPDPRVRRLALGVGLLRRRPPSMSPRQYKQVRPLQRTM
ncbi:MAG: hypothetical protein ACRBN8_00640 [Nannocystales bacterium]